MRPTMMRMNPTLPTATLISWPISRIRSAVVPEAKFPPKISRIGPGTTSISSRIGIVPAIVQRVSAL